MPLDPRTRAEAEVLAEALLAIAAGHIGLSREVFEEACDEVVAAARDRRLAAGLCKLVEDRCEFAIDAAVALN